MIADAIRPGTVEGPNPVEEVVRPGDPKREQMVLTEAQMRRLINAADTIELCALVRWFCELALRFSEATGLPIAAYNARQRTVRIRRQADEQREPKPLRMVIKEYAKAPWPNPYELFFTDVRGGILREPNSLRDRWRPLLRRAGFETVNGKKQPHTCAG